MAVVVLIRSRDTVVHFCISVSERCSLSPEGGLCRAYFPKFYYDPDTASCQSFVYGGCGGNANNFNTIEECMAACSGAGNYTLFITDTLIC